MIEKDTVWNGIWPVVQNLVLAALEEDTAKLKALLVPRSQSAELFDLFGIPVFDILLKTVLGRERLGLARAIETENGRFVYLEFAWPDPTSEGNQYAATDVVSVQLKRYRNKWRVVDVNPASTDLLMTEPRANSILLANQSLEEKETATLEPWLLPVALFAGALQLPIQERALRDSIEALLLPGLQARSYGLASLVGGRRLWRDFHKKSQPELNNPAAWAAAAEFLMAEQGMREQTQAAVGQYYQVNLTTLLPRIRQIKQTLSLDGLHERYSPFGATRVMLPDKETA
ncbi:MAG: hypothetical protein WAM60_22385 [Candidatus Promineifilaceae bacterium]